MRPVLLVIAGPNGAGKTTLTKRLREERWSEGVEYLNPDEIARDRFGDWNSSQAVADAANWAEARREEFTERLFDAAPSPDNFRGKSEASPRTMTPVRVSVENLWTYRVSHSGGTEREPLSRLGNNWNAGHIHGRLSIEIAGRSVPHLGFFGPDDVCLNTWLVELCNVVNALVEAPGEYTFDEGEQGQPAFQFVRVGDEIVFSITESVLAGGRADTEWQGVRCPYEDSERGCHPGRGERGREDELLRAGGGAHFQATCAQSGSCPAAQALLEGADAPSEDPGGSRQRYSRRRHEGLVGIW